VGAEKPMEDRVAITEPVDWDEIVRIVPWSTHTLRFLPPVVLAVGLLTGSAGAKDRPAVTAWVCSSPSDSYPAKYVIEGDKLKKHDPGNDMMGDLAEELRTTYQIVLNNEYGLVGISPDAGKYPNGVSVSGHMIVIDKGTGNYLDTLLVASPGTSSPKNDVQRGACIAD
jgi:hypothetical protein